MIDINLLRSDPEKVKNILKIKNYDLDSGLFTEIDSNRKTLQIEVEDLKSLKNKNYLILLTKYKVVMDYYTDL